MNKVYNDNREYTDAMDGLRFSDEAKARMVQNLLDAAGECAPQQEIPRGRKSRLPRVAAVGVAAALVLGIASYAAGTGGRLRTGFLLIDTGIAAAGMLIISIAGIEAASSISHLAEAAGNSGARNLIDIMALALMAVPCVLAILTVKADEQRRRSRGYLAAALLSADKTNRAKEKE